MMMRRVTSTLEAVNSGMNYAMLLEKADVYDWKDGKRVSDTPIGVRLTLALPGARMLTLPVKFPLDPLPKLTDEKIEEATASCNFLFVQIPDCIVTLYNKDSGIGMTATAETAQIVTLNNSK
ncbi:MAG: hypothetical protein HFG45_02080 [Oscillospiraceae bacterium]|jgi:hypothetical protein|nr:hypothetical protein [Oscillospiraceae bacterium]